MIGGGPGERSRPRARFVHLHGASHEDAVQRPDGHVGGEGVLEETGTLKPDRRQEFRPERAPEVVQITSDDQRRLRIDPGEGLTREEAAELLGALAPRQAEVEVVDDDRTLAPLVPHDGARLQRASLLAPPHREIHVVRVVQRPTAQDRVAVAALLEPVLRSEHDVRELERFPQLVDLDLEAGLGPSLGDLLEQGDVRPNRVEQLDRTIQPIPPVRASDTFVDVPGDDSKIHASKRSDESAAAAEEPRGRGNSRRLA